MSGGRQILVVLLLVASVAGAGYSFYVNFLAKPKSTVTPEQRAEAYKAIAAFNRKNK